MSDNKPITKILTPEEQVNLHLAMQGNNTDFASQPEQEPSEYSFCEDDFRRFLDSGKASVSFAELSKGDDNISTIVPIDTVFDTLAGPDTSNPEIYEYVAVSILRKTGDMVVLGHRYAGHNSRRRRTEQVMPLQATSVGALLGILGRLEEYLFDDDE